MQIKGNKIIFRSMPRFYEKEHKGIKCNTVRKLNPVECEELENHPPGRVKIIRIENTLTGEWFERVLTDISYYQGIIIFSWGWVL